MTLQQFKVLCLAAITISPMIPCACATARADNHSAVVQGSKNTSMLISKDSNLSLRLPAEEKILYKGAVSSDFVASVARITGHGIFLNSDTPLYKYVENGVRNKLQEAADKELFPYQTVLASYNHRELMQSALEMTPAGGRKRLVGFSETPGDDWFIESMPIFSFSPDQRAIILENNISIYPPGNWTAAVYKNIVKVVSQPKSETDIVSFWTTDNGKKLKEESAGLFAESLGIALSEAANMANQNNNAHKTFRYFEGSTERMERGQLISEHCDRVVIKTLRGTPMSIPTRRDATVTSSADQCGQVTGNLR